VELLDYHIFKKDNRLVVVIAWLLMSPKRGMKSAGQVVRVTVSRLEDLDSNLSPITWASSQHPWQVLTYRWSGLPSCSSPPESRVNELVPALAVELKSFMR
jgi:hypothetical protein